MKMIKILSCITTLILTFPSLAFSAVVLNIDNGQLTGAEGINVNGNIYNVAFQEGTCADLFSGCDELSDFLFPIPDLSVDITTTEAYLANQALVNSAFVDSSLGQFDSNPELIFGCDAFSACSIITPVNLHTFNPLYNSVLAVNFGSGGQADGVGSRFGTPITSSTFPSVNPHSDTQVFAIWSNATVVPVPAAFWLFTSGLIGLIWTARKPTLKEHA